MLKNNDHAIQQSCQFSQSQLGQPSSRIRLIEVDNRSIYNIKVHFKIFKHL